MSDLETGVSKGHNSTLSKTQYLWQAALCIAACLSWTCVSSLAILVNKYIMVDLKFHYPVTVAAMGMVTTSIASLAYCTVLLPHSRKQSMTMRFYLTRVMPTGFFMAVTFTTGNMGYLYLTVAFVQMLKAFCPVITMLLLFAAKLEKCTVPLVFAVVLMSTGVTLASYGELHMSVFGMTAMLISVVSESVRLVLTQYLLVGRQFHPIQGLMYISPACSFWLIVQAMYLEWPNMPFHSTALLVQKHSWEFLAAAFAGFGVNLLAVSVIKLASSLTLKVLGTAKDAFLVCVGVMFLHEQVTALQFQGYSISLLGFGLYNWTKVKPPSAASSKTQ